MQSVTATGPLKDSLREVKTLVEVRDESGVVIGFFAPVALENAPRYAAAAAAIDPIAAKRASKEGLGKTTAEVLDYLHSLEQR